MSEIVVYLDPSQGGLTACSVQAPFDLPDPHLVETIDLNQLPLLHGPDAVKQVGKSLAEKIRQNVTVDAVLNTAFLHHAAPPSLPICFRAGDPIAHSLSLEALVENDVFVALDERWPIARIPRGGAIPVGAQMPFAPPLKLVCVLSAVGLTAIDEWNGIYQAVQAARAAGLPISLTVFAGEEVEVINVIDALGDNGTSVHPIPNTPTALLAALEEIEPHVLHFYCHGTITGDVRRLEIGTIGDFDRNDGASSVLLRVEELGESAKRTNTWAVILNTCRGAEATGEALTHAEEIVSRGVPVAIGMRRQVDTDDAVAFSSTFYPAAFGAIENAVAANPGARSVGWADMLLTVRRTLRDNHGADPAADDAWTLPVLYTRLGSFEFVLADQADPQETTRAISEAQIVGGLVDIVLDEDAHAPGALLLDLHELVELPELVPVAGDQ